MAGSFEDDVDLLLKKQRETGGDIDVEAELPAATAEPSKPAEPPAPPVHGARNGGPAVRAEPSTPTHGSGPGVGVDDSAVGTYDEAFTPPPGSPPKERKSKISREKSMARSFQLYEQAKDHMSRKAEMSKTLPAGCTFTPVVNPSSRSSSVKGADRFKLLYEGSEVAAQKRKDRARKLFEENADHTFKPRINKFKSARTTSEGDPGSRLYGEAEERRRKLEQKRKEREDEVKAELKPRPAMTKGSRRILAEKVVSSRKHRASRSISREEADEREKERARKAAERELAECTFKPKIRSRRQSDGGRLRDKSTPVHQRLQDYGRKARIRRELKRQSIQDEELSKLTFKPEISEGSKSVLARRAGSASVGGSFATSIAASGETDDTFMPPVGTEEDVSERLHREAARLKRKLRKKRRELEDAQGITFKPKISETSRKLSARTASVSSMSDGGYESNESTSSVWERLYRSRTGDTSRVEKWKEARDRKESEELTFKPAISAQSKAVERLDDRRAKVWDRLFGDSVEKEERLAAKEKERMRDEERQYSFKPRISKTPRGVAVRQRQGDVFEDLHRRALDRDADVERVRQEENRKLTFRPKLSNGAESDGEMAHKKKTSRAGGYSSDSSAVERLYDPDYRKRRQERAAEAEAQRRAREEKECTFKPMINHDFARKIGLPASPRTEPAYLRLYNTASAKNLKSHTNKKKNGHKTPGRSSTMSSKPSRTLGSLDTEDPDAPLIVPVRQSSPIAIKSVTVEYDDEGEDDDVGEDDDGETSPVMPPPAVEAVEPVHSTPSEGWAVSQPTHASPPSAPPSGGGAAARAEARRIAMLGDD